MCFFHHDLPRCQPYGLSEIQFFVALCLRCSNPPGRKSGNRSQKPDAGELPLKFRHLAKHSSLFLVTPAAKADDKRRGGTKLFCRSSNRHPSPSGWEGGRRPGGGAAVTGSCLASLPPCCEPGANHAANRAANQNNLLLWRRYWLVGSASEPLWLRVAGERRWPALWALQPPCRAAIAMLAHRRIAFGAVLARR
jgi:hypothetical protein